MVVMRFKYGYQYKSVQGCFESVYDSTMLDEIVSLIDTHY